MNVDEHDELDSMIMTMSSEEEEEEREETVKHLLSPFAVVEIAPAAVVMNVCPSIEFVTMHDASYEDENEMKLEMER